MARPPRRRPLQTLPDALLDQQDDHGRRQLADFAADMERKAWARRRIGLPGGAACPPFLGPVEAEAPGAARLYVALDGERFGVERAVEVGAEVQVDRAGVAAALEALRRAELVVGPDGAWITVPPGGAPD